MAITPNDLDTDDEGLARRVLVQARAVGPIDDLVGEPRNDAIAILNGLIAELPAPGESRIKSMSRNGTSLTLDIRSAFTTDVRTQLRALFVHVDDVPPGMPRGSFPSGGFVGAHWAEGDYT